jgi:hypothetical protein
VYTDSKLFYRIVTWLHDVSLKKRLTSFFIDYVTKM